MASKTTTAPAATEQHAVLLDTPDTTKSVATIPTRSTGLTRAEYDADDLGSGFEDTTANDFKVPFFAILQKNSPQVEDGNPRRIPDARAGTIMNSVTNRLYDGKVGIRFIPVVRKREFVEWVPRDQGGGFVAVYDPSSPVVQNVLAAAGKKFGKLKVNDDNDLVETFSLYGLLLADDGSFTRGLIAFASTQIGTYQALMTRAMDIQLESPEDGRIVTPPLFAHVYRLKTEFTTKKTFTWYKWLANFDGEDAASCRLAKDSPLYAAAKEFRNLLKAGSVSAAYETAQQDGGTDSDDGMEM